MFYCILEFIPGNVKDNMWTIKVVKVYEHCDYVYRNIMLLVNAHCELHIW